MSPVFTLEIKQIYTNSASTTKVVYGVALGKRLNAWALYFVILHL